MEITIPKKFKISPKLGVIIFIVIVAGLSFWGGRWYQKDHPAISTSTLPQSATPTSGFSGMGRRRFGGRRGIIGTVTAISPTSISVQSSATGTVTTLSIATSTQITNNGQTAATTDIQVGSKVAVVPDTTTTSQAARILINPTFGAGAPAPNSPPAY